MINIYYSGVGNKKKPGQIDFSDSHIKYEDAVEHILKSANNFLNQQHVKNLKHFYMNFYIDASYSGTAKDAVEKWVTKKGGSVKLSKENNQADCKLDFFDREDVSFHINIYTSCKANEESFDLPQGLGSVWSTYLMDQGDKKPKPGTVLTNKNQQGTWL